MSAPIAPATTVQYGYRTLRLPEFDLEGYLTYDARRGALTLTDHHGEVEVLSVDLWAEGYVAAPGEILVRDWSEHAGLAGALVDAGVAMRTETLVVGPLASRAYRLRHRRDPPGERAASSRRRPVVRARGTVPTAGRRSPPSTRRSPTRAACPCRRLHGRTSGARR